MLTTEKQAFDMNVTSKLITVPGRVLTSPDIKYAGTQITKPRFGSWNMQSVQLVTGTDLPRWTYLRITLQGTRGAWPTDQDFNNTLDRFQIMLKKLGINVTKYMAGQNIAVTPQNLEPAIDTAIHRFAVHQNRPKLILVIVPEREMTMVYNRVKYACDIKEGILNVCVLDSKFSRANDQYFANVGLKFNLKLGGRNHSLDPSKMGILGEKKTMVVGIDVTHPAPGSSSNAPSVAGIVASVDEWLGQWPADLRIQSARQEMVEELDTLFKSRLRLWQKRNKTLPDNVLVYRDGVSEGQYNLVLEQELPALRKACEEVYPATATKSHKPRMTIIIVGKRHNTRFYPTKKEDADRSWNPQNGTVVDRGVTEARNWDFFLQAHAALQGTARPAHYYVIYDQIFRDQKVQKPFSNAADAVEDLSHNMCYLFGRATKAISRCPPAYYADLVCDRARCYLSGLFDPSPLTSPTPSVAGSTVTGTTTMPDPSLVSIHPNVRDAMFYI
jgi:eukaryotic translation initiation factor 2C